MGKNGKSGHRDVAGSAPSGVAARRDAIEWVRVAAACGVVWFHIKGGPFKEIGHSGLIAFVLISVVFQAAGARKESFRRHFGKRLVRIAPPWLFWFAFYGAFNLLKGKAFFPSSEGVVGNLLTGPWIGLWFFPFILIMCPVVYGFALASARWNPRVSAAGFFCLGGAMLVCYPHVERLGMGAAPWLQWFHALPALPLGMGLQSLLGADFKPDRIGLACFLVATEVLCLLASRVNPDFGVSHGLAALAVCGGFVLERRLPRAVTRLGAMCLGVYVLHSAVITVLKFLPYADELPWVLFLGTVVVSFAAVALLRRAPLLAKVL